MKRRDFIKGFAAVSAAVPLASALANTKGAESVIKTYQMKDVKTLSEMKYTPETVSIVSPRKGYTETIETPTVIGLCPVYVMAFSHERFQRWVHDAKLETEEEYSDYLSKFEFRYVNDRHRLFGLPIHLQVIGLWEYWLNPRHAQIMEAISVRSMEIVTSDKLFTAINKNNRLV